ncbi:hypothetical protein AHAS_Ahas02G0089600 [Arachis hypogaea]
MLDTFRKPKITFYVDVKPLAIIPILEMNDVLVQQLVLVYMFLLEAACEHSGPSAISFLVAGFAATLSTFCYAKLFASRRLSTGSAYH